MEVILAHSEDALVMLAIVAEALGVWAITLGRAEDIASICKGVATGEGENDSRESEEGEGKFHAPDGSKTVHWCLVGNSLRTAC